MPITSGTAQYPETSLPTNAATGALGTVAELRGVPTASMTTGDMAYVDVSPNNASHHYVLDKASVAADNGTTVIATKESLLGVNPALTPGRWRQSSITF